MGTQANLQQKQIKIASRTFWLTFIILILTACTLLIVFKNYLGNHSVGVSQAKHPNGNSNLTDGNQQNQKIDTHDTISP